MDKSTAWRLYASACQMVGEDELSFFKKVDTNVSRKRRKERARQLTAQRMAEIQAQTEGRGR